MPYGVFVKIDNNLTGLIPNSEMGTPRGTNHSRMFPENMRIQVVVVDVDEERGRITLSRSQVEKYTEQKELTSYMEKLKNEEVSNHSLGNLGELLKDKFGTL